MLNVNRIKSILEKKNITKKAFAEQIGISEGGLHDIFRNKSTKISTINNMAKILGVSVESLYSDSSLQVTNVIYVPISAQAGYFHGYSQDSPEIKSFWLPDIGETQHFAFNVSGDSMAPTLLHGDMVICQKLAGPDEIKPGAVYVLFDKTDGVIVKRLQVEEKHVRVVSDNLKYPAYTVPARSITQVYRVKRVITANI
jgi:phage repressor protein C with HTH and peptisase S24 domain